MTDPGVYFGLPEDEYHAIPALSNSGIKWLRVSPLDFWTRSWMNPQDCDDEQTDAMRVGSAYHARIIEGHDVFYSRYAPDLDPEDHPHALRTLEDMKAWLSARGEPKSGTKALLAARILEADPEVEVWDVLAQQYRERQGDRILLSTDLVGRIELAAAMIERHPHLCKAFVGGAPEVTVIWDAEGIPMKARIDRLKARAIVDLKTFSNPHGKPIDIAIAHAVASGRYHIQAAVYDEAARRAVEFIAEGRVFGDIPDDVLAQLGGSGEREFLFVFQQTGTAPVARGKVLPKRSVFDLGRHVVEQAKRDFRAYLETYGTEPWVDPTKITEFDDTEFPAYLADI